MEVFIIFQRMLMLLAMMALGYISYKRSWLDESSHKKLSQMVVNIFNPALVINGAITATGGSNLSLVKENLIFVAIYYGLCIIISFPVAKIASSKDSQKNMFMLMTIFSNVGFMGIPVISSIYGNEAVIFITFYILAYNVILYTLGIYIAQRNIPKEERKSSLAGLVNIGMICSIIAIGLYFSGIKFNDSVLSFFNYVGNATIPLSMIVIGASVAKIPFREIFKGIRLYVFAFITLLLIPIVVSLAFKGMKKNEMIYGIFILLFAMPVGSIVSMLIKEYGGDETLCSKTVIITTLLSIITIPIVTMFI
ncbi:AEC family transporter [Pseudobutyrivibrio sp.]|uniref:AEC family transporter n=1 Tax=Pseudobutyrivibrio sp. TaxID=2014367 RepID=UPI0025F11ABE|nr:AEC family transporter [Pseudobutyrivibrio sp.]MBR5648080.1 AEC family transporter [Pseudobutyrivibrio sp.]